MKQFSERKEAIKRQIMSYYKEEIQDAKRKKWLKIYSVLVSEKQGKEILFDEGELSSFDEELGIYRATIKDSEKEEASDENSELSYLVVEYVPGLILLITTATKEQYRRTLKERIKKKRGTFPMKIKPDLFRTAWQYFTDEGNGHIYRFSSRRKKADELMDELQTIRRPRYRRRFNYTGDDGDLVIDELKEEYGVQPEAIYIKLVAGKKVHLTTEGLFSSQDISKNTLDLFFMYLDTIKDEILRIKRVSENMRYEVKDIGNIKTIYFSNGIIDFEGPGLDESIVARFPEIFSTFSFIDTNIQTEQESQSLDYTTIVLDETKKSVFNVSANEKQMLLIPKHNMTFESILDFYYQVVKNVDSNASLSAVVR